jgi:hypothetical protein
MGAVKLTLRVPQELHNELVTAAARDNVTVAGEILRRLGRQPLPKWRWEAGPQPDRMRGNRFKRGIPPKPRASDT